MKKTTSTQLTSSLILGLFLICGALFSISIYFFSSGDAPVVPLIVGGIIGTIGLYMLVKAGLISYSRSRMGVPDIILSKERIAVGEEFTCNFHHTFQNNITIENIIIRFIYKETATYQQGTDTRTVIHEEIEQEFEMPGGDFRPGHMISDVFTLQVPPDGMHTLKVRRNQIQWFIRVEAVIPRLSDFVEEIEVIVLPELAVS